MRTPALTAWRREIAARERSSTTFDALWRAACAEMSALEFRTHGVLAVAASCRRDAQRIVRAAARGRVA